MGRRIVATIVNWNEYDRTVTCLERLVRSEGVSPRVLVVDNGSRGEDADRLESRSDVERVVRLSENRGYAGGMNAGLRAWLAEDVKDPILILTPDAELAPRALRRLVDALDAEPGAGVVGPVVVYRDGPDPILGAGGRIEPERVRASLIRRPPEERVYEVGWIDGCCMLVRPEALASVGGFDERYFIYFEETDLCHRLHRAGWSVHVARDAIVRHPKEDGLWPYYYYYYMTRNRFLFWRKSFDIGTAPVLARVGVAVIRTFGSWIQSLVLPRLWRASPARMRHFGRQLRGAIAGTRDHLRGRYGRMGGRQVASSSSDQLGSARGS